MTASTAPGLTCACTSCGAKFRFKPEMAGKKLKCTKCGEVFPAAPAGAAAVAAAVVARGGYVSTRRSAADMAAGTDDIGTARNWVLPGAVLGLGLLFRVWQAFAHAAAHESVGLPQAMGLITLEWVIASVALAAGLVGCIFVAGLEVNDWPAAGFKAVACTIFALAAGDFLCQFDRTATDVWGIVFAMHFLVAFYFFMLSAMFKSDLLEALLGGVILMVAQGVILLAMAKAAGGDAGALRSLGRPA